MTASRAAKIANDIAEDIDCGESREELRECIKYWAAKSSEKTANLVLRENKRLLKRLEKAIALAKR